LATAGASAALTGLVFVAVSINIQRIIQFPGLPERALETVVLLLGVAVVSVLGLVPGQSRTALGAELLGEGIASVVAIGVLMTRSLPHAVERHWLRVAVPAAGTLPVIIGGASLLAGGGGGLYWILGGMIGALVGGVLNAWVLLVEILR
jgi:hypothetical protein